MNSFAFGNSTHAASAARRAVAIDLVHLSRQTFGDRTLETELLRLFDAQLATAAIKLAALATDEEDLRSAREVAHLVQGSARAVGALEVGAAAETYEEALADGDRSDAIEARGFLLARIAAARADIADLLA